MLAKNPKYAHVQGKLKLDNSIAAKTFDQETRDVKAQIMVVNRKIGELENEMDHIAARSGGVRGQDSADMINNEIIEMKKQIREAEGEMERLTFDFENNDQMFKSSQKVMENIHEQIREATLENERLKSDNIMLTIQTKEGTSLDAELTQILSEKDNIEQRIRDLTQAPFMRKDKGESVQMKVV